MVVTMLKLVRMVAVRSTISFTMPGKAALVVRSKELVSSVKATAVPSVLRALAGLDQ